MGCFARNSALRAALDPATDDLLFDIVINDLACGRIAARHCGRIAHLRAGSCAVAGAHVDGFAAMSLVVLPMRSAKKQKNISEINGVTLLPMESGSFVRLQKAPRQTSARH